MKRTVLFILILLAGNPAFSQDYAPLPDTGIRRYFTNAAGYLRGIRVDSVVQETGYKRYVTFRTARGWKNQNELADSNGACWIGKNVRAYPNGDWHFPNVSGDTILVKTGAKTGDTWAFHRDNSAIWTEASVLSVDTQTVFGVLDSVKRIGLTRKNGSTVLSTDPIGAFQIILSKAHGLAQVPDLYLFPYKGLDSAYNVRDYWYRKLKPVTGSTITPEALLFTHVHGWNLPEREMYDFQVGDVTYTGRDGVNIYSRGILDTIIARQDFPDYTKYTYNRWSWQQSQNGPSLTVQNVSDTVRKTNNLTFDTLQMPEEYFGGCYSYFYLYFKDSSFCSRSLLVEQNRDDGCGLYVGGLSSVRENFKYKTGLGLVYYRYSDGDGQRINEDLYSFRKNGLACGVIPSVPSGVKDLPFNLSGFRLYPQPATTEVFLEAPQLRYPATIRIQNLQGQLLSTQELSAAGKPVSTANMPAGLYLISVTDAGGNSAVQKLLIEGN